MEYKSSDIKNTKSREKMALQPAAIKEKNNKKTIRIAIIVATCLLLIVFVIVLIFKTSTNEEYDDNIDNTSSQFSKDYYNEIMDILSNEEDQNKIETINNYFDEQIGLIENVNDETTAGFLVTKADVLLNSGYTEDALTLIREVESMSINNTEIKEYAYHIGMKISEQLEDDGMFADYQNKTTELFKDFEEGDEGDESEE